MRHLWVIILIVFTSTVAREVAVDLRHTLAAVATSQTTLASSPVRLIGQTPAPIPAARAYLVAYLAPDGELEVLLERNASQSLPLASVSKLMTARLAARTLKTDDVVVIDPADVVAPNDVSLFKPGDVMTVGGLLHSLLIESSNYSAAALARRSPATDFIAALNHEAQTLGMAGTAFVNPSGLDPVGLGGASVNYSTAYDLLRLAQALINDNRGDILSITQINAMPLYSAAGEYHHLLVSTNKLLNQNRWPAQIIAGKTGQTDLAGKNLLLILRNHTGGYLISVVLGAADNFAETSALLDWIYQSYQFS